MSRLLSPLIFEGDSLNLDPAEIVDDRIRAALGDQALTRWGMDVDTVNEVTDWIRRHHVRRVLEFGSGFSTVVLALACRRNMDVDVRGPRVVAIEESESFAAQTRALLAQNGLGEDAVVLYCPLVERRFGRHTLHAYDWEGAVGRKPLDASWRAELVFVDGPSSGGLARAAAAADGLRRGTAGCCLLMDDGLRVFEIRSMRFLARHGIASYDGVIPIGKGIAVGRRMKPERIR